ncbi:Hypp3598 [Branchiostoma lanceolatum]|uniref:Hypp3598 protein n=1 Tax=Branchiostoma lanceolatum TaxID=7740 RepID=A0A8K0A0A5_BRALA|nr:Hypp3598 [Branchiostoma lanceolatum]
MRSVSPPGLSHTMKTAQKKKAAVVSLLKNHPGLFHTMKTAQKDKKLVSHHEDSPEEEGKSTVHPPKPVRCRDFVINHNNLGQFQFLLFATEVPERSFGDTEETLRQIHVLCHAAGRSSHWTFH